MIVLFTAFVTPVIALVLGAWLAAKGPSGFRQVLSRILQGVIILFTVEYLVSAMIDTYYARTYWPSTPLLHSLGPDWPKDLFWKAIRGLKVSGIFLVVAFSSVLLWRRRKAA